MKVILVNGSPKAKGCTYTALMEVAGALEKNGIETEIFQVGAKPIAGCIGCGACKETGICFMNDVVNEFVEMAKEADGFVFGSPVHYAAASGAITSFLDRAFYGKSAVFAGKPGAAVVSCRRGGASAAFDQLNKYFGISGMPVVPSQYWNQVHGNTPEEVRREIQACIDEAWNTDDLAAMNLQRELFPDGKPTPEQFISTVAKHLKSRQN